MTNLYELLAVARSRTSGDTEHLMAVLHAMVRRLETLEQALGSASPEGISKLKDEVKEMVNGAGESYRRLLQLHLSVAEQVSGIDEAAAKLAAMNNREPAEQPQPELDADGKPLTVVVDAQPLADASRTEGVNSVPAGAAAGAPLP